MPLVVDLEVPLRWADFDMLGHVTNAQYLNLLGEGRDALLKQVLADGFMDSVIVRVELDFRHEVAYGVTSVQSRSRIQSVGTTSLRTRDELLLPDGTLAAEAITVVVVWDSATRRAVPWSDGDRARLTAAME